MFAGCPRCRAEGVAVNLTVEYDLTPLAGVTPASFPRGPRRDLALPGPAAAAARRARSRWARAARRSCTSSGSGAASGLPRLYAKDESQNPTWSYKDRLCAMAVSHAVAIGARVITISSTGNHGASTAAYAARAGLPCVIFTMASVPDTMKTLMQAYGAAVVACPTSEARWALMRQGVERLGWYPTSGFVMPPVGSNPWGIEGYKTIAYEIAEDLGWTAPDVVVVPERLQRRARPASGRAGRSWAELGLVKSAPRMIAAEPFGPLAHALERALEAPGDGRGAGAVRGLLDRLALRHLAGPGRAPRLRRRRRAR